MIIDLGLNMKFLKCLLSPAGDWMGWNIETVAQLQKMSPTKYGFILSDAFWQWKKVEICCLSVNVKAQFSVDSLPQFLSWDFHSFLWTV